MKNKPSICFVAHFAYGALAGIDTRHIGGIERQTSMMARWFVARGYDVSMITWDEDFDDGIEIDGVRIYKMCRQDVGLPVLRFFMPRWSSLIAAMKRADADIYYYNCGDLGLGQIALWCKSNSRKCVYSVASNPDCDKHLPVLKPMRERVLYRYGLKHTDSIVVQTKKQQQMLSQGFDVKSSVIPMPCQGLGGKQDYALAENSRKANRVLWVGRISLEKRFEWLLDIAEKCRDITFDVLGASNNNSEYSKELLERVKDIPNIVMHGRVKHTDIAKFYCQANVLCCTSEYEGFPNTFLEAWSVGLPVVTTFDPDDIVAENHIGSAVSSIDGVIDGLRDLMGDPGKWEICSKNAQFYYLENHTLESSMAKFEQVFDDVVKAK